MFLAIYFTASAETGKTKHSEQFSSPGVDFHSICRFLPLRDALKFFYFSQNKWNRLRYVTAQSKCRVKNESDGGKSSERSRENLIIEIASPTRFFSSLVIKKLNRKHNSCNLRSPSY